MLALWVPHYLTWPIWIDIDQFATMSMGWDRGTQLPYRDLFTYNFPGQIYLFWLVGKLAGWGNTAALYAFDASLLVALGVAMAIWSRVRFGRALPGLVGYLAFLSFYLGLAYHLVLQRDWHCGFFAVMGLMTLQVWHGRLGRLASAVAMAAAILIRPQAVLYLPAFLLALDAEVRKPGESLKNTLLAAFQWCLTVAALVAIGFVPLVAQGIFGDFVHAFRQTIGSGPYTQRPGGPAMLDKLSILTAMNPVWSVLIVTVLSTLTLESPQRRTAWPWIAALVCVCLYIPLTPIWHLYHHIPIILIWSFNLSLLVHAVLEIRAFPSVLRLGAVGLVVLIARPRQPEFCQVEAVRSVASSKKTIPPGYRSRSENTETPLFTTGPTTRRLSIISADQRGGAHTSPMRSSACPPSLTRPPGPQRFPPSRSNSSCASTAPKIGEPTRRRWPMPRPILS